MDIARSTIQHILKTKSIVQYLESKGHQPVKQLTGARLSYLCPLAWHNETKPSFVVWLNSEYENYYCFGCQSHSTIINLVMALEGIKFYEAVKKLYDGIELSLNDFLKHEQELLTSKLVGDEETKNHKKELANNLLDISSVCRSYLKSIDKYSDSEIPYIERLWKLVDTCLLNYDIEGIEEIKRRITPMLIERQNKIRQLRLSQIHIKNNSSHENN